MVLNLQCMIYKLASITKQIICTLMHAGSPENLVVREKFKVANNKLFPCQADPQKCMYIFPVAGVPMSNRRRFSMVAGASGKPC